MPTTPPGVPPGVRTLPGACAPNAAVAPRPRRPPLALRLLGRLPVLALWTALAWRPLVGQPPIRSSAALVALTAGLAWWYLLRRGSARRRARATLRLRGPGRAGLWLGATVPVWVLFNHSVILVQTRWSGPPPAAADPLEGLADGPTAWLPLLLFGLVFAPLLEEIFFRGFLQRPLERRFGAAAGILLAAALFAAYHCQPWRLGYLLTGGIVFGAFVHAARSLWAGVALHAAANGSLALLDAGGDTPGASAAVLPPAGELVLLLGSLGLLVLLHARVRESSRRAPAPRR